MKNTCFEKGRFVSKQRADAILAGALRILAQNGVAVPDGALSARLAAEGFAAKGGRVYLQERDVLAWLEAYRARTVLAGPRPRPDTLDGMVGIYSFKLESFEQRGLVEEYTEQSLIRAAQFVEKCAKRFGFTPNVPGYAKDVPSALESLHKYWISAKWCHAGLPTEPSSITSARWMFEMADVMGEPMTRLPIYPASPLNLSGESVDTALEFAPRLKSAYVYAMSLFGVTTPMSVELGFAMNLAEVLGAALLMERALGVPVDIRPNLIPFDLRTFNVSFGSTEKLLLEAMSADLCAQLLGAPPEYLSTNIHTWAKTAGMQAAAEKTALIHAGALLGARKFYCIGSLCLDETFSPYQLLLDLDAMEGAKRLIAGFPEEALPDELTEEVAAGLTGGFPMSDRTLDCYTDYLTSPLFADRAATSAPGLMEERIEAAVRELDAQPCAYALDDDRAKALDAIYRKALAEG